MSMIWLAAVMRKQTKPRPTVVQNLRVASPCPIRWEQMSGDDCVRRCQECKLDVYNLSDMTASEAEKLLAAREGRLCVRFHQRADGTVITRDCPVGIRSLIRRASRIAGAALSAVISLNACAVQPHAEKGRSSTFQTGQQESQPQTGAHASLDEFCLTSQV